MSRDLALFDFDGTLTRGDTMLPFLRAAIGPVALARALAASRPGSLAMPPAWSATIPPSTACSPPRSAAAPSTISGHEGRRLRARRRPEIVARNHDGGVSRAAATRAGSACWSAPRSIFIWSRGRARPASPMSSAPASPSMRPIAPPARYWAAIATGRKRSCAFATGFHAGRNRPLRRLWRHFGRRADARAGRRGFLGRQGRPAHPESGS